MRTISAVLGVAAQLLLGAYWLESALQAGGSFRIFAVVGGVVLCISAFMSARHLLQEQSKKKDLPYEEPAADVIALVKEGNLAAAIKLHRTRTGMHLGQASALVREISDGLNSTLKSRP